MRHVPAWAPLGAVFCLIWALAFASMLTGNPTAINAVVGIPAGALLGGAFIWGVTR